MVFPSYTVADLAAFSGRDDSSYSASFVTDSAVPQAETLFGLGTCLTSLDSLDTSTQQLAKFGILAMADAIVLSQPFQEVLANPFSSETIGSYSYSKVSGAILAGLPTGIAWFDLAVQTCSVCDLVSPESFPISSSGIEVFEWDGNFRVGVNPDNTDFVSPSDVKG